MADVLDPHVSSEHRVSRYPVPSRMTHVIPVASRISPQSAAFGSVLFLVLLMLLLCAGGSVLLIPVIFPPGAVITIIPVSVTEQAHVSLVATTTPAGPGNVQARIITATSPQEQATVAASGIAIQPARVASGTITFFNLAPYAQVVGLGTVLTAAGGIQVRTLEEALVPAGNAPVQGSATVSAQALQAGTSGNLPPGAIDTECCGKGILAENMQAWASGADPGTFTVVLQHDIDAAAAPLLPEAIQAGKGAFGELVRSDEQLATFPDCTPHVESDKAVGSQASTVTVTVSATCQGEAFERGQARQLAATMFSRQVRSQLGAHFLLIGQVRLAPVQVIAKRARETLTLSVLVSGRWVYQLDRSRLRGALAGQAQGEATAFLARTPGILHATINNGWDGAMLPADPRQIHIAIVGVPQAESKLEKHAGLVTSAGLCAIPST